MILVLLLLFSLVLVELVNNKPISTLDDQCQDAMRNVFRCVLMLFQTLVAGDSWGACALPIIDIWFPSVFLFAASLVCVQLGFTNLILAVIVDSANAARDGDKEQLLKERQ